MLIDWTLGRLVLKADFVLRLLRKYGNLNKHCLAVLTAHCKANAVLRRGRPFDLKILDDYSVRLKVATLRAFFPLVKCNCGSNSGVFGRIQSSCSHSADPKSRESRLLDVNR